jgi:type III protein arginine methyltransferase
MAVPPPPQPPRDPLNDPAHFLALGLELANSRAGALALSLAERARALHPDDPLWQALAAVVQQAGVPEFHARMLHDRRRNAAYRTAIERFAPGRRVLDIGTGSGLLAMMAARAGADHVYACEENTMLAASARAVIAANGLADRITVFDRHSGKLDRLRDLDGGVDLVISEVFSHCLVGEGVLESLAHARARLVTPGAIFLPEQASVMVALAEFPPMIDSIGMVEGFDLSGFSPHLNPRTYVFPDDPALALRSEPACVLQVDFAKDDPPDTASSACQLASTGGMVSGLAQWLHLRFADDITYENRPASGADLHWAINLAACEERLSLPGELYSVGSWYSQTTLVNWCRHLDTD